MNSQQYRAGFCIDAVRKEYQTTDNNRLRGLLDALCIFDLYTHLPVRRSEGDNPTPLFAVLNNIICRGLPTRPSIAIEKVLASNLNLTQHEIKAGSHLFGFRMPNSHKDDIQKALHIVDPRVSIRKNDYQNNQLGSTFEQDFLFSYLPDSYRFLNQVFQSQRALSSIVDEDKAGYFQQQRVDFSLESPYWMERTITKGDVTKKIQYRNGLVVEIDGKNYHTFKELANDTLRNWAQNRAEWRYNRINSGDIPAGISAFKQSLDSSEYIQTLKKEYDNKSFDPTRLRWWQLVLSPIAIARIQKLLVELLLQGLWPQKEKVKLGIIEWDVPCGCLAIQDFITQWQKLSELQAENIPIPEIEITVFTTPEFRPAELHQNGSPPKLISDFPGPEYYDLVIDHSIWRRSGIYEADISPELHHAKNTIIIRSAHYADRSSERKFYTGRQIKYHPVVESLPNDIYKDIPEARSGLTFFLQNVFRKEAFRPGQLPILSRALQHKTVIGLLPTGGGKSLTYQMAALLQPGVCMVIDPIRALMQDQYESLLSEGIDACNFINSTLSAEERNKNTTALKKGRLLFCFVSPERLQIEAFREALSEMKKNQVFFSYCVIDEVHCVSEWGHDFRTSYLALGHNAIRYCQTFSKAPITLFGLTATASFDVLADVERELAPPGENLDANAIVRFENTVRPELHYIIIPVNADLERAHSSWEIRDKVGKAKQDKLITLLKRMGDDGFNTLNVPKEQETNAREIYKQYLSDHERKTVQEESFVKATCKKVSFPNVASFFEEDNSRSGIIFCPHRTGLFGVTNKYEKAAKKGLAIADKINLELGDLPVSTGTFIGSSNENDSSSKKIDKDSFENQRLFRDNHLNLMVSTKAFGMGIDKPNIRFTIHINYPSSIESFVQESGRAGRDGRMAINFLLYSENSDIDKNTQLYFHNNSFKGVNKELSIINELLTEIIFPPSTTLHMLEEHIAETTGFSVKLNIWEKGQTSVLYVNEDYGSLNLRTNYIETKKNTDGAEEVMHSLIEYLNEEKNKKDIQSFEALKSWLNEGQDHYRTPGIEQIWKALAPGAVQTITVPFMNAYAVDHLLYAQQLVKTLTKFGIELNVEKVVESVLIKKPDKEDEVIQKITRYIPNLLKSQNVTKEILAWWHLQRTKNDTDKAIFRLLCLGLVDDYTVDYNQKTYTLTLKKNDPVFYRKAYLQFLERYYSDQRAANLLEDADRITEATQFRRYLRHMIDFIYDQIGQKRRLGIEDMESLCRQGLVDGKSIHEKNRLLKEYIFLYFNSKYARRGYEVNGEPYSLVEEIKANGSSWETVWKYMKVVQIDPTGSDMDNVKHLRGATLRLLRANPDNSSLQLLKGFTLLIIAAVNEQRDLIPEAIQSLSQGFLSFQRKEQMSNLSLTKCVDQFKLLTLEFTNRIDIKELLEEALSNLYLEILSEKITHLKHQILTSHG